MRQTLDNLGSALARFRLDSIRGRVLALVVLAALVPLLVISIIAYAQNRRVLTDKVTSELVTAGAQAARETDVWLKERLYDLRVFASSYVVTEALSRGGGSGRLGNYLGSVRARFSDYEELQLVDLRGRLVGSSARDPRPVPLPEGWTRAIGAARNLVGEPYLDEATGRRLVMLGVPVDGPAGQTVGALIARVNFATLEQGLRGFDAGGAARLRVTTARGAPVAEARGGAADHAARGLPPEIAERLLAAQGRVIEYPGAHGGASLGSAARLGSAAWLAVAEVSAAQAYAPVARLRNATLLAGIVLLLLAAVVARRLAALIVRPLGQLAEAAGKVSAGDLSVDLPQGGSAEVANLTRVFNTMVGNLRAQRGELERLSTTDSLTGLANRRQLMNLLDAEAARARRASQPFALLMLDVDHFKKYNDQHGHQAGDDVLVRLAAVLRESTRPYDCAARYGGEEFIVALPGSAAEAAHATAERIRERMRAEPFVGGPVTVSIGVAEYPRHGDTVDDVIGQADAALYAAKRAGRDCVRSAGRKKA